MREGTAGNLLRKARLRRGISQASLATRAGLGKRDLVEIEDGRRSPSVEELTELLHLLGEELVTAKWETGIDRSLNESNLEVGVEQRVQKGLDFADLVRECRSGGSETLGSGLHLGPLLRPLHANTVDFVVVGSIAGLIHGSAYPTYDLDLALSDEPENLRRFTSALEEFGLEITITDFAEALSFETQFGTLDLIGEIPGIRSYEELRRDAQLEVITGVPVRIASLDHLIAMKRASTRRKDQLMMMEYVELAELRWRDQAG